MTWSFHYGEKQIGAELSLAAVERLAAEIEQSLLQASRHHGFVWFTMQHENSAGGVAEERILISPGVPICFLEE